ncbi:hypothetical protein [Shinella sp.]|uniref:hypothetical protein n=1 Tax=Shinella sp. TaxID=1870904 RepID=UPI0028AD3F0D|nr:hypothetical protein [Shinella sp.]
MSSQARIEKHHDLQESRAKVLAVELLNEIPMPSEQFDRAVELLVDREPVRPIHPRPKREAA